VDDGNPEGLREAKWPRIVPAMHELRALPTPLNLGEYATLASLSVLGSDWHVFVQPRLSMAQPDFVAIHPEFGVWVIEVKDWNPELYRAVGSSSGRWIEVFNGDQWVKRVSPRKQLQSYEKTFRERFFVDFLGAWVPHNGLRVLLVMPQYTRQQATDLLGTFPVVSGEDISQLADRLMLDPDAQLHPDRVAELLRWLDEPENVSDQRMPLILSTQAEEVARNSRGVARRRVRGPAGSGKSLALASRAIVLASQGKDVLIVTFNITLGHYLHDLCARAARQQRVSHWKIAVSFTNFHRLLSELMEQREELREEGVEWETWALQVLSRAYSEASHDLPTYDAILVDEGQDFESDWWRFLSTCLLRPNGEMLLAADRTQNLFDRSNWTATGSAGGGFTGPWVQLKGTYRTPVDLIPVIVEYAQKYLPAADLDLPTIERDHPALADAHEPTRRKWVNVAEEDIVDAAANEVVSLIRDIDGLSPSDIVLLTDHGIGMKIITELRSRGNDVISLFAPTEGDARRRLKRAFWAGSPGIKGCTIHSFKGWESKAVVCVPTAMGELELYVAMTRVKADPSRSAYLTVVNAVDSLREFKPRFEREILPSEVPALRGQTTLKF